MRTNWRPICKPLGTTLPWCTKGFRSGKTTAIRCIAVRETTVSRHHGEELRPPLKFPVHHSTIILRDLRGPLIGPPLCRETWVSRTANVSFSRLGRHQFGYFLEIYSFSLQVLNFISKCRETSKWVNQLKKYMEKTFCFKRNLKLV